MTNRATARVAQTTARDVQHAQKAERRQEWAHALAHWQHARVDDPNHVGYRLRAAGCMERLGDIAGACAEYRCAADWYARQGFLLKAVATIRHAIQSLHEHCPNDRACIGDHLTLASLFESLELRDEAHAEYAAALREMPPDDERRERTAHALRTLIGAPAPERT